MAEPVTLEKAAAWPERKLLRPFTCVAQEVGIARTPRRWRGSVLSLVGGKNVCPPKLGMLALTGKEMQVGEHSRGSPERELIDCDLSALNLSGCNLSGNLGLGSGWKIPRDGLIRLSLCCCNLSQEDLVGLFQTLPSTLQQLDISGNELLGDSGAKRLIKEAEMQLLQLEQLGLGYCTLSDEGVEVLCAALCHSDQLEILALNGNRVTDKGCMRIGDLLLRSRWDKIDLDACAALTPDERQLLETTIEEIANDATRINYYHLLETENEEDEGNKPEDSPRTRLRLFNWVLEHPAVACPPLRSLNLSDNDISSVQVLKDLLHGGEHRLTLSHVAFHGNLDDVFGEALLDAEFCTSLALLSSDIASTERQARLAAAMVRDRPVPCPFECEAHNVRHQAIDLHLRLQCTATPRTCMHCLAIVAATNMKSHWREECAKYPLECALGCGFSTTRLDAMKKRRRHTIKPAADSSDKDFGLAELMQHEHFECELQNKLCSFGCGQTFRASLLEEHQENKCLEKVLECTFLVTNKTNSNGLVPCGAQVTRGTMEAHLLGHRAEHAAMLIQRASVTNSKDAPGAESAVARGVLIDLEKLCASVALPAASRSHQRDQVAAERNAECRSLKAAMDRALVAKRSECFENAKIAFAVWHNTFPRKCLNPGCGAKALEKDFPKHAKECAHRAVTCELCCETEGLTAKDIVEHLNSECPERWVECNRGQCKAVRMRAKDRDMHDRDMHTVLNL